MQLKWREAKKIMLANGNLAEIIAEDFRNIDMKKTVILS